MRSSTDRGRGGGGGRGVDPVGYGSVDFSDVGLVIDLLAARPSQPAQLLIWRGVYRDRNRDVAKLVESLPASARKLLGRTARPAAACAAWSSTERGRCQSSTWKARS